MRFGCRFSSTEISEINETLNDMMIPRVSIVTSIRTRVHFGYWSQSFDGVVSTNVGLGSKIRPGDGSESTRLRAPRELFPRAPQVEARGLIELLRRPALSWLRNEYASNRGQEGVKSSPGRVKIASRIG